ncbi:MAG: hypothetical protein KIS91_00715 [Anaerolineae bacterium]|nr:hypothetical protein [Anaerolineae bacterium]
MLALTLSGCSGGVASQAIDQNRLDTPAPRVEGDDAVGQTFLVKEPGLSGVELLLAVYPDAPPPGALTLRLYDDTRLKVAEAAFPLAGLRHNEPLRFDFAPQGGSAGRRYTLTLSGPQGNPATVWSTTENAYGDGAMLEHGQPRPGDLNFKVNTRLGYGDMLLWLVGGALAWLGLAIPLLAVFFVPGFALTFFLTRGRRSPPLLDYSSLNDPAGRFALSTGLSLAFWPLLFLLLSFLPFSLNAPLAWGVVGSLAVLVATRVVTRPDAAAIETLTDRWAGLRAVWSAEHRLVSATFTGLLLLIAALRTLHARGLAVSPWVDSIQHAVATQLFTEGGRLPTTWGPSVFDIPFVYHFGFHSTAAVFTWLSGLPIENALLMTGQVAQVLVAVSTYVLTARLTGRRGAGLVAMAIVGAVTLMPSYYLTWGRYTQLTGLALLSTAAVLAFDAISARPPVGRRIALAGFATGALVVTHYRVLIMLAALVGAYLIVESVAAVVERRSLASLWLRAFLVGGAALLFTLPWFLRLGMALLPSGALGGWLAAPATFNTATWDLLALRYKNQLLGLAGLGILLSVTGAVVRAFDAKFPLWTRPKLAPTVGLAVALAILVTNPGLLGLRNSWVISNDSLIITGFLPVALLSGYAMAALMELLVWKLPWRVQHAVNITATVALLVGAMYFADGMLSVVNPVTVLATDADVKAAEWVRQNTPTTARFLVNARPWQEGAYAAPDGGGWLPVLADRQVTLPPVSYTYANSPALVDRVTRTARTVAEAKQAEDILPIMDEEGAGYVYIGAKGGALKPEMFRGRSDFRQVYATDGVWIFERLK